MSSYMKGKEMALRFASPAQTSGLSLSLMQVIGKMGSSRAHTDPSRLVE